MPDDGAGLDALVSVIETLQERIRRDHATIGSNETRTRRELIDPVLGALGWVDSSVVTPEYLVRYGPGGGDYRVADYALHAPGQRAQPIAFIEAKRMREDLTDDHREQAFTYAYIRDSARYVGLTNGDRWEFYEAREDRFHCILDVSIRDESAAHCAEELLPFKCGAEDFENGEHFGHTKGSGVTAPSSRYQGGVPSAGRQSYRERSGAVDTRRVLGWSVLVALCGVIVGYVMGFWAADPVLDELYGVVGAVVVGILLVVGAVWVMPHLPWHMLSLRWLWPIEGDARKTFFWSCGGIVVGGALGGTLGYVAGVQTAQFIYDILAGIGVIAVVAGLIGAVVLMVVGSRGKSRRRGGRRRSRRYRGRRR